MPTPGPRGEVVPALSARRPAQPSSGPDRQLIALVEAAREGDNAAWARLVKRFDRMLRDIARSYRLTPADVDDVVQITWMRMFRHIERLREPAAVAGWLGTTVRRESLRRLQAGVREHLTDDPRLGDRADRDGPEGLLLAAERRAILARALATLPDRHRRLMTVLATQSSVDYRQISAMLAIPAGSIGPIRARSLARLGRRPELQALRATAADHPIPVSHHRAHRSTP